MFVRKKLISISTNNMVCLFSVDLYSIFAALKPEYITHKHNKNSKTIGDIKTAHTAQTIQKTTKGQCGRK